METLNDYCQHRLLVVGPKPELTKFERNADITGVTDFALEQCESTRIVWSFVTKSPALQSVRVLSRCWPQLTFFLHYDCEDCRLVGLVWAKNGRLRQHRFKY